MKGLEILCQKGGIRNYILFEATCGFAKMCNTECQVIFSMSVVVTFDQFFIGMSLLTEEGCTTSGMGHFMGMTFFQDLAAKQNTNKNQAAHKNNPFLQFPTK